MRLSTQAPRCPVCPVNGGGCLLQGFDPRAAFSTLRATWGASRDYEACTDLRQRTHTPRKSRTSTHVRINAR